MVKLTRRYILWVWDFKFWARMGYLKLNHKINSFLCQIDLNLSNIKLDVICICYSILFVKPIPRSSPIILWETRFFFDHIYIYPPPHLFYVFLYLNIFMIVFSAFFFLNITFPVYQMLISMVNTIYVHKRNT